MSNNRCKSCGLDISALVYQNFVLQKNTTDIINNSRIRVTTINKGKRETRYRQLNDCCIIALASMIDGSLYLLTREKYPIKSGT